MGLTFSHLLKSRFQRKNQDIHSETYFDEAEGIVTLKYPYEAIPVPDHGRYKLHNEIEDCIVCDKCAKICPVDCIDIEPIKSVGEFGRASDGTPKRIYAAKFDIDMAKCCFCALCTTVCPTECLTMTPEYDFSTFDITTMNFGFGNMTEAEAESKRREWEVHHAEKQSIKASAGNASASVSESNPSTALSGFRPRMPGPKRPSPSQTEGVPKADEIAADLSKDVEKANVMSDEKAIQSESSVSPQPSEESIPAKPDKPKPPRMRPVIKLSDPNIGNNA